MNMKRMVDEPMRPNDMVEIKMPGCLLYLTTGEMLTLLKCNRTIWERGIKRGKGVKRAQQTEKRKPKNISREINGR